MKKLAVTLTLTALVATASPVSASAHRSAAAMVEHALGPGTSVSECHSHGSRSTICAYSTPAGNLDIGTEDPTARWHGYAVVEHGVVRS